MGIRVGDVLTCVNIENCDNPFVRLGSLYRILVLWPALEDEYGVTVQRAAIAECDEYGSIESSAMVTVACNVDVFISVEKDVRVIEYV